MIFSRNRGGGGRHSARRRERDEFGPHGVADDESGTDETDIGSEPESGPYDIDEVPDDAERLDLGSLKIPVPAGVELRVQADEDGQIQQVLLVSGESALQLGVFAAPRTEGIWDEVRADIRKQLFADGVAAEEADGEYGIQLRARVRTPDGLTDIRFAGIDGPRWMVRAVFQGPAATDPTAAAPLDAALRGLVVDRGGEAMPVRDPLPLRLPREIAERAQAERAAAGAAGAAGAADAEQVGGSREGAGKPRPSPARTAGGRGASARRKPSPRPRRG